MADSKVSELTAATSAAAADLLYLVQSNTSKKITVANLCKSLSNVNIGGNLTFSGIQTLASPGIVNNTSIITHLVGDGSGGNITIPTGAPNQLKYITYISGTGTYNLTGNLAGSANVEYNNVGDASTLLYTNNKWFVVGGTANVVY
jgi:hypothetical protein